ncbi:FecR family protein [Ancylomarina salipaludis]|uniref:FecR family protein n=1 Tax=Ancylomarina salipaludis TaxID=2501299 RepID=A0A4Q1JK92_9BACT|nr:FecR family protein [Ancylomarina salipaludis]RXQ92933.1 FecR family protein [Ancylomarina salipaludis]
MNQLNSSFKIAELISKRLKGKLSLEESHILDEWKYDSKENLDLYHKLSKNPETNFFKNEEQLEKVKKEEIWHKINTNLQEKKTRKIRTEFLKYAASIIVIGISTFFIINSIPNKPTNQTAHISPGKNQALLMRDKGETIILDEFVKLKEEGLEISNTEGHLIYTNDNKITNKEKITYNSLIIPKGGEYNLTLSDGTKIWLNSNSKLKYPTKFSGKERLVELEGEAFFDVSKNKDFPFVVKMNDFQIKVLGTSFNVNAYNDEKEIITTLVEGRVEVKDQLRNQKEILLPNDQFCINKYNGDFKKTHVDTEIYTAWKNGRLVFQNERLEDIMIRLSRWYNVEVFFLNNESKDLKFTGDLARYEDFNNVLEMIEFTDKVKFSIKNRSVLVEKLN